MIADRFAPIRSDIPDLRKPTTFICVSVLEPARVQPCEAGMDDQGDWMLSGGREILEGMLVCECPEAA